MGKFFSSKSLLTRREFEVLVLCSKSYTNQRIAKELFISENTVKNHLKNIYYKMDAHCKLAAVVKAIKAGILEY